MMRALKRLVLLRRPLLGLGVLVALLVGAVGGCMIRRPQVRVTVRFDRGSELDVEALRATQRLELAKLDQKTRAPARRPGVLLAAHDYVELRPHYWAFNEHSTSVRVVLVADPENSALNTLQIVTGRDQGLTSATVLLIAPDGRVRRLNTKDFYKTRSGVTTSYKLALPGLRRGTLVAFRKKVIEKINLGGTIRSAFRMRFSLPCSERIVRYVMPKSFVHQVKLGQIGPPELTEQGGQKILRMERRNIPALDSEPQAPAAIDDTPQLIVGVSEYRVGRAYVRKPRKWSDIARLVHWRLQGYMRQSDGYARRAVSEMKLSGISERQKLQRILERIQSDFVAEGSFHGNFWLMAKTGRGNPILLTALAQKMAQAAGVPASFALLMPPSSGGFDEGFTSLGEMTVPALAWQPSPSQPKNGDKSISPLQFSLPYRRGYRVGELPFAFEGRKALVIDEVSNPSLVRIALPTTLHVRQEYDLQLDAKTGRLVVKEKLAVKGPLAASMRESIEELSPKVVNRRVVRMSSARALRKNVKATHRQADGWLIFDWRYELPHALTRAGNESLLSLDGLFKRGKLWPHMPHLGSAKQRTRSVETYPLHFERRIRVGWKGRYKLAESIRRRLELHGRRVETPFGTINTKKRMLGRDKIEWQQVLDLRHKRLGPDSVGKFEKLVDAVKSVRLPTLLFTTES